MAGRKSIKPITQAQVDAHRFVAGTSPFLWDHGTGAVSRFGIRATPAGGKQYVIRYSIGRQQRQYSLGPVGHFASVDEARREARALKERLEQRGIDPAIGRDGTMHAVWNHYIEGLRTGRGRKKGRKGKPASPKTLAVYEQQWRTHLKSAVGDLAPADVTVDVIDALHEKISQRRTATAAAKDGTKRGSTRRGGLVVANRALAALQAAWRANARGLTRDLADPFKALERNAENVRKVVLRRSDLPKFLEAVAEEPEHLRAYWQLMILTGARGGELRGLTWADVDLEHSVITFRDTKGGGDHEVPLSAEGVEILSELPRAGKLVFPFSPPKSSWTRILKRSGITGVRPHDVRRSVGSWLGAAGMSSKAVGALLGHKSDITSKVYIQLDSDPEVKRTAAELQAELVAKFAGNLIDLEAARKRQEQQHAMDEKPLATRSGA